MSAITSVSATDAIGFPLPWHKALAYGTAHSRAVERGLANELSLERNAQKWENQLLRFIAKRNQDDRPVMTMEDIHYL